MKSQYSRFIQIGGTIFVILLALNVWLGMRRAAYASEIERLRQAMSEAELQKSDLIIRSEKDRLKVAVELLRRQARWAPMLNLSIDLDSGVMYLARDGAVLRRMPVKITPGLSPGRDSAVPTLPLGERSVLEVKQDGSSQTLVLDGGERIFAAQADSVVQSDSVVSRSGSTHAASIVISSADMKAILPNVATGMAVYIY